MHVLALSSSRVGDGGYLTAAVPLINGFLGAKPLRLAFVPFATADNNDESYLAKVKEGLSSLPHELCLVTPENGRAVIEATDGIVVGGGNTFKLLHDIYRYDLFALIRESVENGKPYIGWSAGSNLAGRTICTTNDMPIIQPQSFTAFGFLPFQLNPHYYNVVIEGFHGETRDQRLNEFLLVNPGVPVVGLPEGTALHRNGDRLQFLGTQDAALFQQPALTAIAERKFLSPGSDLSFLLQA
ncbi:dipeptidase PepE [Flavisolibacter nicotianae]|uniref:dipeptidase PepE n=1 Tax=Flavisolibacter nicotianae TaxID=2364882 RepID=UPI000EB20B14|nr:dipeptidase PepE [Flavisolibacter nicotianae]